MSKTNLPVQELDFKKIKDSLRTFLNGQTTFQDYNFEGSSLSILLDVLAYNTHYMGYYAHMLANEAFIDSANLKSSLTSKAKLLNYVPKSKQAAQATVKFHIDIDSTNEPSDRKIIIQRGTAIKSENNLSDGRIFVVVDDVYIYNNSKTLGVYDYSSDNIQIYEGTFEQERFIVDSTLTNQRFIIKDKNIDIKTLQVKVYPTENSSDFVVYKQANDFTELNGDSPVYFISMNENDYYEIFFGNGVYGKTVENGNMISCTFVSTNGELGNNAKQFSFNGGYEYNGNPYNVTIETISKSAGGMEAESIEDLRFNIPYHYRRQNRTVTIDDYKNIILSEYRNVNSVNVWGGEDNEPKTYGKVFISIKPKFGEVLSSNSKNNIINNILKKYNVATIDVEIIDPDYLYINLDISIRYNPLYTNLSQGEIKTKVHDVVDNYNVNVLNKFGSFYSNAELTARIKESDNGILTAYTKIMLEKRFVPALNSLETYYIDFINSLVPGTIKSDEFQFRLSRCYFTDNGKGEIVIYYWDELKQKYIQYQNETFGEVDYIKGIIRLTNFEVNSLYTTTGVLNVFAQPEYPDFFTKRNNIVVIDDVVITTKEDYENNKV